LFAGTIAIASNDIKKVLAYSTVSQLGFMFMGVGSGFFFAGIFHLVTHAFFKACLFLGSGSVIHGMGGEQDIRRMGGLFPKMKITAITFIVASLALAGLPYVTSGFFSKESILGALWISDQVSNPGLAQVFSMVGFAAAGLTAFYMTRLVFLTFFGKPRWEKKEGHGEPHESPRIMTIPLIILAILSIFGGLIAVGSWLNADAHHEYEKLAPHWFITLSFVVSLGGIGLGMVFYWWKADLPAKLARTFRWVHNLLLNKWYVDEIYDFLIVTPLKGGATGVWFVVDRILIDTVLLVNAGGRVFRRAHTGVLSAATAGILAGAVAAIAWLAFRLLNNG
ncbi:MAG: proton-conducting transporter transmembrane domain-containing protein, partial [Planctomycetota bacterium]